MIMMYNPVMQGLVSRIIESKARLHNEDYQQLLIESKELQIKIIQKQQQQTELLRAHRRHRKGLHLLDQAIMKQKQENASKSNYLQQYYAHLSNLYATSPAPLRQLEAELQRKYLEEQKTLNASLAAIQTQHAFISHKHSLIKNKPFENQVSLDAIDKQNIQIQNQITLLQKEEKELEKQEKMLKKILNIQEEHKRFSKIIVEGIRKLFFIHLKEQAYQQAVNGQYVKNTPGINDILAKRGKNRDKLKQQLLQKTRNMLKLKQDLNVKISQYNALEDQIISKNK